MFWYKKRKIFKVAKKVGCDMDGDIIIYKGNKYYIHMFSDICYKVGTIDKNLPYLKRRKRRRK